MGDGIGQRQQTPCRGGHVEGHLYEVTRMSVLGVLRSAELVENRYNYTKSSKLWEVVTRTCSCILSGMKGQQ